MKRQIICLPLALMLSCGRSPDPETSPLSYDPHTSPQSTNNPSPSPTPPPSTGGGGGDGPAPPIYAHEIFLSSQSYTADLGGLAGADQKCQALANTAGKSGTWRAVLSDGVTSAGVRLKIKGAIANTRGTVVASGAMELWSGQIKIPIQHNEKGMWMSTRIVWTGTNTNGGLNPGIVAVQCSNWTSANGAYGIQAGRTDHSDHRWIAIYPPPGQTSHSCSNASNLYCINNVD